MTELLEQAIDQLRQLPEDMQDAAAQALLWQLDDKQLNDCREVTDTPRSIY